MKHALGSFLVEDGIDNDVMASYIYDHTGETDETRLDMFHYGVLIVVNLSRQHFSHVDYCSLKLGEFKPGC